MSEGSWSTRLEWYSWLSPDPGGESCFSRGQLVSCTPPCSPCPISSLLTIMRRTRWVTLPEPLDYHVIAITVIPVLWRGQEQTGKRKGDQGHWHWRWYRKQHGLPGPVHPLPHHGRHHQRRQLNNCRGCRSLSSELLWCNHSLFCYLLGLVKDMDQISIRKPSHLVVYLSKQNCHCSCCWTQCFKVKENC